MGLQVVSIRAEIKDIRRQLEHFQVPHANFTQMTQCCPFVQDVTRGDVERITRDTTRAVDNVRGHSLW